MKSKILLLANSIVLSISLHAQTETFDIATFVPPAGWQRLDSNGIVAFLDSRTNNGLTSFCQIFVYPSHPGTNNSSKDFKTEWTNRVVRTTGTKEKPKTATEKTPDGWSVVTGSANIVRPELTYTCILVTASGFGKVMTVMVNLAGEDYLADVNEFFDKLELNPRAVVKKGNTNNPNIDNSFKNTPVTGPASLGNYIYTPPAGWTTTSYPDGIVLSSAVSNTGENCNITLWPMRSSSGNLQNDANNLFAEVFKTFQLKTSSTPPSMIKGLSPQGWEYFIVKRGIGMGGDYQTMFGFAFVAKLGNEIAAISGISKDPLVSSCFGLMLNDVWPKFFYSLQFKNWKSVPQQQQMINKITGVWTAVTGTSGDRFVFAANGRFAGASAAQKYIRLSSTQLLRITDSYFGDGSYKINGNGIVLVHDSNRNAPESGFLRLEQESKDGINWVDKLYLLRKSVVDGSEYEVGYDKQN